MSPRPLIGALALVLALAGPALAVGMPAAPVAPADALAQAAFLTQAGEWEAALRLVRAALPHAAGADRVRALVQEGFILGHLDRFDEALVAYRAALAATPPGTVPDADAGHGELWSLAALARHTELETAAEAFARAHPDRVEGFRYLGAARLALGDVAGAKAAYDFALIRSPDDPLARAGQAAAAAAARAQTTVRPATDLLFAFYTRPVVRQWVLSGAAEVEVARAVAPRLWLVPRVALAYAHTHLRDTADHAAQLMPHVGLALAGATRGGTGYRVSLAYTFVWGHGYAQTQTHLAHVGFGLSLGRFHTGVDTAFADGPSGTLSQNRLVVAWGHPSDVLQVALAGIVSVWPDAAFAGDTVFGTGELGLTLRLFPWWRVEAMGYGGRRRHHLASEVRFVWNTDDVFVGGYRVGFAFPVHAHHEVRVSASQEFGREMLGFAHDFWLVTVMAGWSGTF